MSLPTPLPSAYEISRLAVALRGRKAVKQPIEAVREALGLWFVATSELEALKAKKNLDLWDGLEAFSVGDATERYFEEQVKEAADWGKPPPWSDASEAMKDLAEKGAAFKTRSAFLKAWKEMFGEPATAELSPYTPEKRSLFLHGRIEKKRAKDAERKRKMRKAGQEPVK